MDQLKPANDNYDKSIKHFYTSYDVAEALVEHVCEDLKEDRASIDESSIVSVVERTTSIPALVTIVQRLQGVSFPRIAAAYIDDLLKPQRIGAEERPYLFSPGAMRCVQGVLTDALWNILMGTNPGTFPAEYAERWRIPAKNYMDPRSMKDDVRKYRDIILQHAHCYEDLPGKICREATRRISVLRKAQE